MQETIEKNQSHLLDQGSIEKDPLTEEESKNPEKNPAERKILRPSGTSFVKGGFSKIAILHDAFLYR